MRSIIILLASLLIALVSFAQENSSGRITYEQVTKLEIKLTGDASQFTDMLPKERKSEKVLIFNPEASLFENKKTSADEEMSMNSNGANVTFRMVEPDNKIYTDLQKATQIESREFMTRYFLIESDQKKLWKLTGNQKTILDYPCQEAAFTGDTTKTTVWFTPVIPVSSGPASFGGLPGMILSVEMNDGKTTYMAKSVDLTPIDESLLVKPTKGKKVTHEEFKAIVDEKMKEMGAQPGQNGVTRTVIQIHR